MALSLFQTDWRDLWAGKMSTEAAGAVFTRPEIVDLILDLAGYRVSGQRLAALRVLEPSCGDGAFVSHVVMRLLESEMMHSGAHGWNDPVLDHALTATDINVESVEQARRDVVAQLTASGCPRKRATTLAKKWIVEADFLLEDWPQRYDVIVGNPPYVRIEALPKAVLAQYREQYSTMSDRADVYIAFIQRGLELLSPAGRLAFIVANRWTKNMYGRALRSLISAQYHVRVYLDLAHTQPFVQEVSAYPAIVVVDRERGMPTYAATLEDIEAQTLATVRDELTRDPAWDGAETTGVSGGFIGAFEKWYDGGAPWITTSRDEHEELTRMERELPMLEDSAPGTKVGIGVATGADEVFITREVSGLIEVDRLMPLAMPADVRNSGVDWSGHWLVNPFRADDDGSLVNLADYPGLKRYLEHHQATLRKRHVAKTRPNTWYRTIDRIWPSLMSQRKLLIRDIQLPEKPIIGIDSGRYYPHHNLYYVVSGTWPLEALQCLLRSRRVLLQVQAHSVAMRGGSVRWQAQTLRRVRLPRLDALGSELLDRMVRAAAGDDVQLINTLAEEAYRKDEGC